MYLVYQLQFPIFHAKLMVIGLWLLIYAGNVWSEIITRKTVSQKYYVYLVPFDIILLFYSFFMLKGVSIKIIDYNKCFYV